MNLATYDPLRSQEAYHAHLANRIGSPTKAAVMAYFRETECLRSTLNCFGLTKAEFLRLTGK